MFNNSIKGAASSFRNTSPPSIPKTESSDPASAPSPNAADIDGAKKSGSHQTLLDTAANANGRITNLDTTPKSNLKISAEIIDLVSDDEEQPDRNSGVKPTKLDSESIKGDNAGNSSSKVITDCAGSTVNVENEPTETADPVLGMDHYDLSSMEDNDLYSMFSGSRSKEPPESDFHVEDPDLVFSSPQTKTKQKASIAQGQSQSDTSPSTRLSHYRILIEQQATAASRRMREEALAKQKASQMAQVQKPSGQPSSKSAMEVTQKSLPHSKAEKPIAVTRDSDSAPTQQTDQPAPSTPKSRIETDINGTEESISSGNRRAANHCDQHILPGPTIIEPHKPDEVSDGNAMQNLQAVSSKHEAGPQSDNLERSPISAKPKQAKPQSALLASQPDTSSLAEESEQYCNDEDLMRRLQKNQASRQKHAQIVQQPAVEQSQTPQSRRQPFAESSPKLPFDINRLLGSNNGGLQLFQGPTPRIPSSEVTHQQHDHPSRSAHFGERAATAIQPRPFTSVNASGLLDDNLESIKRQIGNWRAYGEVIYAIIALVRKHGFVEGDSTSSDIEEVRIFGERLLSGDIVGQAGRRRMHDIRKNVVRRRLRKIEGLPADHRPESATWSTEKTAHFEKIIDKLELWASRGHDQTEELNDRKQKATEKNRPQGRKRPRDEQKGTDREARPNKRARKEAFLKEKLQEFEKREETTQRGGQVGRSDPDSDENQNGGCSDAEYRVVSDVDEDWRQTPTRTSHRPKVPTEEFRPTQFRSSEATKGLSIATLEKWRRDNVAQGREANEGLERWMNSAENQEAQGKRPTTGGKTINDDFLRSLQDVHLGASSEEDSDDEDDEELWMYQVWRTEYGGAGEDGNGTPKYLASFYTLGEANRVVHGATLEHRPSNAAEDSHHSATLEMLNGVASSKIQLGPRNIHYHIERVEMHIRDAGLRPDRYTYKPKIYIVHRKDFPPPSPKEGDDDLVEEATRAAVPRQRTLGVFTTLDHANRAATHEMLEAIMVKSRKTRELIKNGTVEMRARAYLKELLKGGGFFETTENVRGYEEGEEGSKGKVKIWVEEQDVQGPRN